MASGDAERTLYPIDVENVEEMDRLIKQARLISEHIGLLPTQVALAGGQSILDIGCGPGEWVLEMAHNYPDCHVTGLDISQHIVVYAQARARIQHLTNAEFTCADACHALPFPDASIDLIHMRFITGFLPAHAWPDFLKECFRILRPGGFLCSIELENMGIANSPALMRYSNLLIQYMRLGQHCFTSEGPYIGIMAMQAHLLQQGGFKQIQQHMHVLNYSLETPAHSQIIEDYAILMQLMQPALLREKMLTQEELTHLYNQAMTEVHADGFCGVTMFQSVWGRKPG